MINEKELKEFIVSNLKEEHFLIDLSVSSSNQINIFIDSLDGLPISECVSYTRLINSEFEEDIDAYDLSVSSGGLDLSFTIDLQYKKNIENEVEVISKDGLKHIGILKSYNETEFMIETEVKELVEGKKRKVLVKKEISFNRNEDIKSVKPVVVFKKNKKK